MNRDKGFLRLAFILTPVFGVLGLILNRILSVSYWGASLGYHLREDMYLTLVQSIWRFVTDSRYRWMGAGKSYFIAFILMSAIPLLAYCAYKYILAGFEEDNGE